MVFLVFFSFAQLAIIVWLYHKLSGAVDRLSKRISTQNNNLFAQIEALLALYAEIKPVYGLPSTRNWAASPDFLRLLVRLVNENTPKTIMECSSGVSTLVLSYLIKKLGQGKVISLEHDPVYAEKTRFLIRQHQLEDYCEIINAPLNNLTLPGWTGQWYDVACISKDLAIDLLVVDGPPWFSAELARYPAFPVLRNQLTDNALIALDDADRDAEKTIVEKWLSLSSKLQKVDVESCEKGCAILKKIDSF